MHSTVFSLWVFFQVNTFAYLRFVRSMHAPLRIRGCRRQGHQSEVDPQVRSDRSKFPLMAKLLHLVKAVAVMCCLKWAFLCRKQHYVHVVIPVLGPQASLCRLVIGANFCARTIILLRGGIWNGARENLGVCAKIFPICSRWEFNLCQQLIAYCSWSWLSPFASTAWTINRAAQIEC